VLPIVVTDLLLLQQKVAGNKSKGRSETGGLLFSRIDRRRSLRFRASAAS